MAISSNKYSDGVTLAFLRSDQMKARWKTDARGLNFLNLAFKVYYDAKTNIGACPDSKHKEEMLKSLQDCATDGWGFTGVNDLEDAFEHLMKTGGYWTDDTARSYSGKFQAPVGGPVMNGPKGAAIFLGAVEEKFKLLTDIVTKFNQESAKISDTSNWAVIQVGLKSMKDNGDIAKKVMWLAPAKVDSVLGKPLETALGFVDILNDIDTAVRNIDKYKQAGMNDTAAAGFEVIRLTVGKVPILGAFYGQIIDELPDFFLNMKEVFRQRQEKILSYAHMQ